MIRRFQNVVNPDSLIRNAYRIRLEDIPGLVVSQSAALNVVGIGGDSLLDFPLAGGSASEGMFQVLPVRKAPWILPVVHQ